ncbi:Calcineurin-like phosphoesterase superfamily domain-containing protein [Cladophialophora immunda]|nr:Calcineurin-like phosphoesterase superfamily domain-containing protein [Cladophialophora immunda]
MDTSAVKTRLLIMSDTHGMDFDVANKPLPHADVAIHCGDLTDGSKLDEFRATINLLQSIDAPLKLVVAGNHDFTLDDVAFQNKIAEATAALDPELVEKEYGAIGEAKQLLKAAVDVGIVFLSEGTHHFTLQNGARLTVYASPYTPALGAWGFQYHPDRGHDFAIENGVDVVITHGPPKGILDYTLNRERAGCASLFASVARARPRVHCFGHIHEGWGARLITWRDTHGERPTHFTAIDNNRSHVIERLATLRPSRFDTPDDAARKQEKLDRYKQATFYKTSHCLGDEHPLDSERTLFVNASVAGSDGYLTQKPWVVDIELQRSH